MHCLETRQLAFHQTGLRTQELAVYYPGWTAQLPPAPGVLTTLVSAITQGRLVDLRYVGMRRGEVAKWVLVAPLGLEQLMNCWRVLGLELSPRSHAFAAYVLPRILDVQLSSQKPPKGYRHMHDLHRTHTYMAELNPELTADQQHVTAHQLQLAGGTLRMAPREYPEFSRCYLAGVDESDTPRPLLALERQRDS